MQWEIMEVLLVQVFVKYTVTLPPPTAPIMKGSTGITMLIMDEIREASKNQARLAKVNI